jgi:hypothetical protein
MLGGQARIARTGSNGAAILVADDGSLLEKAFGLRTSHVAYAPARDLVIEGEGDEPRRFLVLECDGSDHELLLQFLHLVDTLSLVESTAGAFDEKVRRVFELFRAFNTHGTGTPQGLWAELLLIAIAKDTEYLARAWHSEPNDLYDFVADGSRLEVKSTTREVREHEFSYEQLKSHADATIVASLLLRESPNGANVFDLLEEVLARLPKPDLRIRVESIVRRTLGESWREAHDVRFDVQAARASLTLFRACDAPCVAEPIPASVKRVRFVSDLSAALPAADIDHHTLFRALRSSTH